MPMLRAALCLVTAAALGSPGCKQREQAPPPPLASASASARRGSSIAPPEPPPEPRQGMVWIPGGALVAGTPPDAFPRLADEEIPGEQFILGGFYVDVFPYPNEEGAIPLTNVSRDEARTLCQEAGKRLCSELEWERACKGPNNHAYEYGERYRAEVCSTGSQPLLRPNGLRVGCRSDFGVRDLHGGAFQWTSSSWNRGTQGDLVTVRGGNGPHGELVGRCSNGQGKPAATHSAQIGFRCCAGPENTAQVELNIAHARKLDARGIIDKKLTAKLLDALPEAAEQALSGRGDPAIDRLWSWWPVGNDELVAASVCAGLGQRPACGILVARQTLGKINVLEWVPSGFWAATLHAEFDPRDVWMVGGDETGLYKQLISYVWGKLRVGPKERRLPKPPPKKKAKAKK